MIFWVPISVSFAILLLLWSGDELSWGQMVFFCLWWGGAGLLQFFGGLLGLWMIGLVLQIVLAVYLSIRWEMGT